jgi:hypothetical protein
MVDRVLRRYGPFLEKLLFWALEGDKSPFDRDDSQRQELTRKPVRKMLKKNKVLAEPAHSPIRQKA